MCPAGAVPEEEDHLAVSSSGGDRGTADRELRIISYAPPRPQASGIIVASKDQLIWSRDRIVDDFFRDIAIVDVDRIAVCWIAAD